MSNSITILYFAGLAEQLGTRAETYTPATEVKTAGDLQAVISQRGGAWAAVGSEQTRIAVNQTLCKASAPVKAGDEVAFFPPVTGG